MQHGVACTNSETRLSGPWWLWHDAQNEGTAAKLWLRVPSEAQPAPVPGIAQQVYPRAQGVFWYYHRFTPEALPERGHRAWLSFAGVEYLAEVWLNGQPIGRHEGSEVPFQFDVTAVLAFRIKNVVFHLKRWNNPILDCIPPHGYPDKNIAASRLNLLKIHVKSLL